MVCVADTFMIVRLPRPWWSAWSRIRRCGAEKLGADLTERASHATCSLCHPPQFNRVDSEADGSTSTHWEPVLQCTRGNVVSSTVVTCWSSSDQLLLANSAG